jgi:hypothetical protein
MDVFHRPLSELGELQSREINLYLAELELRDREDKYKQRQREIEAKRHSEK